MEILGMIMLRITDQEFSKIRVLMDNKDQRGLQFQVYIYYLFFNLPLLLDVRIKKVWNRDAIKSKETRQG